jgi:outer membrane protein TolC
MSLKRYAKWLFLFVCWLTTRNTMAQQPILTLSEAIKMGLQNFNSIKAKQRYQEASSVMVDNARRQFLPDVNTAIQQNYGTANGQFGPLYSYKGVGIAAAGPNATSQNWNTAFGALYATNINWEAYSFGRLAATLEVAKSQVVRDSLDVLQEKFAHTIKIGGAYFNVLAAQKFVEVSKANLKRVTALQEVVKARAKNGLNAGVDSSIANAEVSNARLSVIDAQNIEIQANSQLAVLLNLAPQHFELDSIYFVSIPSVLSSATTIDSNPTLKFFESRITISDNLQKLYLRNKLPTVNLFGAFQTKASGFKNDYTPDNQHIDGSYFGGISPSRSNFLIGAGVFWNFMAPTKIKKQIEAQKLITEALKYEYAQTQNQLQNQYVLADQRIANALLSYQESPIQLEAAKNAYEQKALLYKNGLSNIIDLTQSLFVLNRAETNINVAYANVWQALLLKAATNGDVDLLMKQAR